MYGQPSAESMPPIQPLPLPLVYSCSGCSSAAQLANHLALRLDRAGLAEMSCIAGVGGNVPALVIKARQALAQGRPVLALDGCALSCARACLAERGLAPTAHVQLHEHGVRKQLGTDFDAQQADALYERLAAGLAAGLDAERVAGLADPADGADGADEADGADAASGMAAPGAPLAGPRAGAP